MTDANDVMRRLILLLALVLSAGAAPARALDGGAIFHQQCAVCHQPNGQGVPGQFPPLAHNPDLFLARDFPLHVVLFGLSGKITVNGKVIDGAMPPLGDVLKDEEIAAVVNYVRSAFGNDALRPKSMQPVTPAMVAELRKQATSSNNAFAYRQKLKAGAKR
jgi:mono/diheme cytochrome c family protein